MLWFGCSWQQKHHAAAPPPARVRRRMERNRQKLVGRDKSSSTEQQRKGTGTTTIQIRRRHNTNRTAQRPALPDQTAAVPSRAASEFPPPSSPLPEPSMRHMVGNTGLCLARLGLGQPTRLCPFLESGENEPCPGQTQDIIHPLFHTIYVMPRSPTVQLITTTSPVSRYHSLSLWIITLKCVLSSLNP